MAKPEKYFVGVDDGSSKVGVLIGKVDEEGGLEVVGKGEAVQRGTRRGDIVNIDATVDALKHATEEAEVMAGYPVDRAYVGISSVETRSVNCRGMVYVSRKDREITQQDIERVLNAAQKVVLPPEQEILHAIPQEFVVDDQRGIADPLGMLGSRLEVVVHLVIGPKARRKTLLTCVNRAGIEVIGLVFEPLATAEVVLSDDEKELGSLLIDLGGGTTSYAVFNEGEVVHSGVIPVGASHFTNDLSQVLRTPFAEAESIKVNKGCCLPSLVDDEKGVAVPAVGGGAAKVVPRSEVCKILQARAEELFQLIRDDLSRLGLDRKLRGGIVLTGGGAQLDGLMELAEKIFDCTVRYGLPSGLGGLVDVIKEPGWSTPAGLLRYGMIRDQHQGRNRRPVLGWRGMVSNIRGMFQDLL